MAQEVSLTSAMRNNLISLQGTTQLLAQTQQRLSSGKKVNSALDNPVNYFSAVNLTDRATDLASYKDGMANAIQTIKAANEGITSITTLINSAIGVAKSVVGKSGTGTGYTGETLSLSSVTAGVGITVDGSYFTGVAGAASTTQFTIGTTDAQTAANLSAAINASAARAKAIQATSVNGNVITLSSTTTSILAADVSSTSSTFTENMITTDERSPLASQYAAIMTQITNLAADASFQGVNLLTAGSSMSVGFGGSHTLSVTGFDASRSGLSLNATANNTWTNDGDEQTDITKLQNALTTLRVQSGNMSNYLNIIQARQDFSTNLGNVLQTGADNLTLADTNEEGAKMLMLQTRNSLGTTALSLSSQAAQSVMRLFG